jgi:hypothetical protein
MNRNVLFVRAGFVVVVVMAVLVVLVRLQSSREPETEIGESDAQPAARIVENRQSSMRPSIAKPQRKDSVLEILPTPVSSPAQTHLVWAIQSVQIVNRERQKFENGSQQERMLASLGKKLFVNDYRYAALATGAVEAEDAEPVYTAITGNMDTLPPPEQLYTPDESMAGSPTLSERYQTLVKSSNPAYREIWSLVSHYDPAGETDLFMDALIFAAFNSSLDNLIRIAAESADIEESEHPQGGPGSSSWNVGSWRLAQDSLRNVFSERFNARGIDPLMIIALTQVKASGGPDLVIP